MRGRFNGSAGRCACDARARAAFRSTPCRRSCGNLHQLIARRSTAARSALNRLTFNCRHRETAASDVCFALHSVYVNDGAALHFFANTWDLTFDMSGGPKGAKRPLERPLDGGVRFLPDERTVFATHVTIVLGSKQRRPRDRVAVRSRSVAGVGACADARGGA